MLASQAVQTASQAVLVASQAALLPKLWPLSRQGKLSSLTKRTSPPQTGSCSVHAEEDFPLPDQTYGVTSVQAGTSRPPGSARQRPAENSRLSCMPGKTFPSRPNIRYDFCASPDGFKFMPARRRFTDGRHSHRNGGRHYDELVAAIVTKW